MSGNRGLVSDVIKELLHRLRSYPVMNEDLIGQLSSLAEQGKLKDISALQEVLRIKGNPQK